MDAQGWRAGNAIDWIKEYRRRTGCFLKAAKDAYDAGRDMPDDRARQELAEFEVRQDGMPVAMCSGPRDRALADIMHSATVYAQDGPVEVVEIVVIATIPPQKEPA